MNSDRPSVQEPIAENLGNNHKVFSIFIDNLPEDLSNINFKDLFSSYEEVLDAYILNKLGRNSGRKYNFIRFTDIQGNMKAIEHMNGKIVGGNNLRVSWARFQKSCHL